jgi:hypothetical protein
MRCWRPGLQKNLLLYVEGTLARPEAGRLERHLLKCANCRDTVLRIERGRRLALQIPDVSPAESAADAFDAFRAMASRNARERGHTFEPLRRGLERWATPQVVAALAAVVLVQFGLLIFAHRKLLSGEERVSASGIGAEFLRGFRQVSIGKVRLNTQPHVAIDGYVEDVHADRREGVVAFRLVEHPNSLSPFLRCEIIRPIAMKPPRNGTFVRVYGVSRYDGQTNHDWYEVNPVLRISRLMR